MAKIKLGIRKNLFYPMMLIIINFFREIDLIVINENKNIIIEFTELKTLIMFLSECISGLIIYKYQLNFLSKKNEQKSSKVMGIKLIKRSAFSSKKERLDNGFKIYFYIFTASFLDFIGFMLSTYEIFENFSYTLEDRLKSLLAILSSLLCYYLLKFPIFRHQKCSLIVIFICLIIIIIIEYIFIPINTGTNFKSLSLNLLFILIQDLFYSFIDIIEKYLFEYDSINPFQMLMFEGIFGFILTFIFSIINSSFTKMLDDFSKLLIDYKILFIICLIIYFILSGAYNSYRVLINKLYSPTTLSLTYCFLDPLFIIFYNIIKEDTLRKNNYYLIINLFLSFFIVLCVCIYNELFVLFCFKLEKDTYYEISERSYSDIIESLENTEPVEIELT